MTQTQMLNKMLNELKNSQNGLTLVEVIIAIAVIGIITMASTMSIQQVLTGTALSNDLNTAVNQVRNAVHWISRDAQMARTVDDNPTDPEIPEKVLELTWEDWEGSPHTAYYILDDGRLERNYDGQQALIAQHIKSKGEGTDCNWDGEVLAVTVTAQVGEETETRTFEVKPRPDSVS